MQTILVDVGCIVYIGSYWSLLNSNNMLTTLVNISALKSSSGVNIRSLTDIWDIFQFKSMGFAIFAIS